MCVHRFECVADIVITSVKFYVMMYVISCMVTLFVLCYRHITKIIFYLKWARSALHDLWLRCGGRVADKARGEAECFIMQ